MRANVIEQRESQEMHFCPIGEDRVMTRHHVAMNMRAVALAEERGSWYTVERLLRSSLFERVRAASDGGTLRELAELESRLAVAKSHEVLHGEDSLLVADHPFNVKHQALRAIRKRQLTDLPTP